MGNFLTELKRRHIYRVAAAYAVVAWVLIQLVNNVAPALRLPEWAPTLVIVLLFVGFPITLLIAWMRELAPADGAAQAATSKLDWALIGALVVVIGLLSYQQLAPSRSAGMAQQASVAGGAANGISVAVLPFVNLSSDKEQEFFSDGMTEEITSALAKVSGLTVVARTSAFQFKGENKDMRAIGQALGASHLIEGSVRKDGNEVRITAQLIKADDGTHLWTESYDRELRGVFAIQEEIATAIAASLRVPLGLREGEQLVSNRTGNIESYQDYLRGRALVRSRQLAEATAVLEQSVARDPNFAPAWAMLSQAYRSTIDYSPITRTAPVDEARRFIQATLEKTEMAARKAVTLDPKLGGGYAALAQVQTARGRWSEAEELYKQAIMLDPNDPEALYRYAQNFGYIGRTKDAVRTFQQLLALEPFVPVYNIIAALYLQVSGRDKESIGLLEPVPSDTPARYYRNIYLARAYAEAGRYSESAETLLAIRGVPQVSTGSIEAAARLIRSPSAVKSPEALPALQGELNFVYFHVGAPNRQMEYPERGMQIGYLGTSINQIWSSEFAALRKSERFKAVLRGAGLVDYWRAKGWPDLCRPMGADDFVCD